MEKEHLYLQTVLFIRVSSEITMLKQLMDTTTQSKVLTKEVLRIISLRAKVSTKEKTLGIKVSFKMESENKEYWSGRINQENIDIKVSLTKITNSMAKVFLSNIKDCLKNPEENLMELSKMDKNMEKNAFTIQRMEVGIKVPMLMAIERATE